MRYGKIPSHIAKGLIRLRERIAVANIPPSSLDKSINIATWNIREFGRKPRLEASIYYIAEILNQFDLIALTELRDDLGDLRRVMDILGGDWDIIFSDFTNDRGGNKERIGYLFDKRSVQMTGLAAEADPPRKKNAAGEYVPEYGWWRSPYMASFQSGTFDFVIITAHIRWGSSISERVRALENFRKWVIKRRKNPKALDQDFIVMGDFNIPDREHAAFSALTGKNQALHIPDSLIAIKGTNLSRRNTYDQILHSPTHEERFSGRGDVLDFYQNDWLALYPKKSHRPKDKRAFTYELSDHLPLWLQVNTEIIDPYLHSLI